MACDSSCLKASLWNFNQVEYSHGESRVGSNPTVVRFLQFLNSTFQGLRAVEFKYHYCELDLYVHYVEASRPKRSR